MPRGAGIPLPEAVPMLADALAYYDVSDVLRWFERCRRFTGHYPMIYESTIEDVRTFKRVPNEPFRAPIIQAGQPMILGKPLHGPHDHHRGDYDWLHRIIDELERVKRLPEGLDSPKTKIGPDDLSPTRVNEYLRTALGMKASSSSRGSISLSWLVQYEVAEAISKALGLTPIAVGI